MRHAGFPKHSSLNAVVGLKHCEHNPERRAVTGARTTNHHRALKRLLVTLSVIGLAGLIWMWKIAWRSPASFSPKSTTRLATPIMSAKEYDRLISSHPRPFIYELSSSPGAILVFGAEHSKNPAHPQFNTLRRNFARFAPTCILVEGRPGSPIAGLSDPVGLLGEGGLAISLARAAGIQAWSWEPTRDEEVRAMLGAFPKDRVALFYVLRPYVSALRHGKPKDPDTALEEIRAKRTKWPGLEGSFSAVAEIDEMWRRDFAGLPDWRDTSDEFGWPGYLSEIALYNRDLRTECMARCAIELSRVGHRVLVLCGSSHAVRAEPALRASAR